MYCITDKKIFPNYNRAHKYLKKEDKLDKEVIEQIHVTSSSWQTRRANIYRYLNWEKYITKEVDETSTSEKGNTSWQKKKKE